MPKPFLSPICLTYGLTRSLNPSSVNAQRSASWSPEDCCPYHSCSDEPLSQELLTRPSLSVVIPNYNHADCLPTAVRAIMEQSVKPNEVLIVDDGSTDNSKHVISNLAAQWYPTIRPYFLNRNCGPTHATNFGIDLSKSDYIFITCSDDEILPGFFERSLNLLAVNPQAGLCCTVGDWREQSGFNWLMGKGMSRYPCYISPTEMIKLERAARFYIPGHTCIMRRDALIEVGKCIPELRMANDWFNNYLIGFTYGICYIPEPLAVYNIHPDSYYKRCRRDPALYRQVLNELMNRLTQNRHWTACNRILEAGSLYSLGLGIIPVLYRGYRRFLTATFLRKCLTHALKRAIKNLVS